MNDINDPYLQNVPMIKEDLIYKNSNGLIYVIFKNDKKPQKFFRKLGFKIPLESSIELDEYSSFVFSQIDGKRNIYQIGMLLKAQFGDDAEPLFERLVTFIDFLEDSRRWVLFKNKMK